MTSLRLIAGAAAVTLATGAGVLVSTAAFAADSEISGDTTVSLDFTTAGSVTVDVHTQNTSDVSAWGSALVRDPAGGIHEYGPRFYAAGEVWDYTVTLDGYSCSDLPDVSAAAFGFADEDYSSYDWTSGIITYRDSRVTVTGCTTPTPPPTTPPPTTPTTPPTTTPATTPATAPATNALPSSKTDGALVVQRQTEAAVGTAALAGALVAAIGTGVFLRRRTR